VRQLVHQLSWGLGGGCHRHAVDKVFGLAWRQSVAFHNESCIFTKSSATKSAPGLVFISPIIRHQIRRKLAIAQVHVLILPIPIALQVLKLSEAVFKRRAGGRVILAKNSEALLPIQRHELVE